MKLWYIAAAFALHVVPAALLSVTYPTDTANKIAFMESQTIAVASK